MKVGNREFPHTVCAGEKVFLSFFPYAFSPQEWQDYGKIMRLHRSEPPANLVIEPLTDALHIHKLVSSSRQTLAM